MRPTRRGWAAVALVALAVVLAWRFTPRGLNAVAGPLFVALAVGVVQVWRAAPVAVESDGIRPGEPGEERTRRLQIQGSGLARVAAPLPDGLEGDAIDEIATLPETVEQSCRLAARGVYEPDQVTVTQRDSLGLVAARRTVETDERFVVYPSVHDVSGHPALADLFGDPYAAERQAFDSLREYVPGDPLRNVHWKSSAKHDDYLVMEFDPDEHHETVTIAAEAEPGRADAMASAAASLAVHALAADRSVELAVPDGSVPPGTGAAQRETVLDLLARTGDGQVTGEARARADLVVRADADATVVETDETVVDFAEVRRGSRPDRAEVVA